VVHAIEHAGSAGDPHLLERMLHTYWQEVLNMYGHLEILERLAGLPADILDRSPILLLIKAWAHVSDWRFDAAVELLDRIDAALEGRSDAEARELMGHVYLLRAVTSRDSGNPADAIRCAEKAFGLLPDLPATSPKYISNASRATLLSILAGSYALAGEGARAEEMARQALQTSQASGDDFTIAIAYSNVSREQMGIGRLTAAERSAFEMEEHLRKMLFVIDNIASVPYQVRGRVHLERFELDPALEMARQAVELACAFRPTQVIEMNRILFTVQDARHEWSDALRTIETMEGVVLAPHESRVAGLMPLLRAQLRLRMGDLEPAQRWAAARFEGRIPQGKGVERLNVLYQLEFLLYGRVLIEEKRFAEAASFLTELIASFAHDLLVALQLEAMVLRAIALQNMGESAAALDLLIDALRAAAPEGFIRPFAYDAPAVARLLAQLQKRPAVRLPAAYLRRVMQACGLGIPVEAASDAPARGSAAEGDGEGVGVNGGVMVRGIVVEDMIPLTSREEEILRLLAQGYSNQKIADKLYVSINTVKTHVSNLFEKLGASSRVDALLRARSARLL
jgi:LuxR family maltose regulon positive regulatory protein